MATLSSIDFFFHPCPADIRLPPFSDLIRPISEAPTEAAMYNPLCKLLNSMSRAIWSTIKENPQPIIFRWFLSGPQDAWGSRRHSEKPDFAAVRGSEADFDLDPLMMEPRPAWPLIDSANAAKPDFLETDVAETIRYTRTCLEQRPDKHEALSVHATRDGYVLIRVDCITTRRTTRMLWDDLDPLISSVYELYHSERDKSMVRRADHREVTFKGETYVAHPIYGSTPPGRRSWLAVAVLKDKPSGPYYVVKDSWRDEDWHHREGDLLNSIHDNARVPGVIECLDHGFVEDCPRQQLPPVLGKFFERRKYRMILRQVGYPLSTCPSTLDMLKLMIDAIQGMRLIYHHFSEQLI
jgi:hypothetical protein